MQKVLGVQRLLWQTQIPEVLEMSLLFGEFGKLLGLHALWKCQMSGLSAEPLAVDVGCCVAFLSSFAEKG